MDQPRPHDRSIFRSHIGGALLNKARGSYLSLWEKNLTQRKVRDATRLLRDISKEVAIEREVTQILRENFSFRFIEIADQVQRMGTQGLERALIGTLASCPQCGPSDRWLGRYSSKLQIRETGLWLIHHVKAAPLSPAQMASIAATIEIALARQRAQRPVTGTAGAPAADGQN